MNTTTSVKTVSQLLEEAAEIIVARGKCENFLEDNDGRVCAMGAINVAHHDNPFYHGPVSVLTGFSRSSDVPVDSTYEDFIWGEVGRCLTNWNNYGNWESDDMVAIRIFPHNPPTTQEVADKMLELAKKYRDRGE